MNERRSTVNVLPVGIYVMVCKANGRRDEVVLRNRNHKRKSRANGSDKEANFGISRRQLRARNNKGYAADCFCFGRIPSESSGVGDRVKTSKSTSVSSHDYQSGSISFSVDSSLQLPLVHELAGYEVMAIIIARKPQASGSLVIASNHEAYFARQTSRLGICNFTSA